MFPVRLSLPGAGRGPFPTRTLPRGTQELPRGPARRFAARSGDPPGDGCCAGPPKHRRGCVIAPGTGEWDRAPRLVAPSFAGVERPSVVLGPPGSLRSLRTAGSTNSSSNGLPAVVRDDPRPREGMNGRSLVTRRPRLDRGRAALWRGHYGCGQTCVQGWSTPSGKVQGHVGALSLRRAELVCDRWWSLRGDEWEITL